MSRLRIPSRAMWLLHAMSSDGGARAKHLRGYGPCFDEVGQDLACLIAAKFIEGAYFEADRHIRATMTRQGVANLALWRREVVRSVDTPKEVI